MNKYVLIEYDFVGPKNIHFHEFWDWDLRLVPNKMPDKLAIYKSLKEFLRKMNRKGLYPDFFKFTRVEVLDYEQGQCYVNNYFKQGGRR